MQRASDENEVVIVDVLESPQMAEDERILATPTLIRELPPPARRIIGDLSDAAQVLLCLDLRAMCSTEQGEQP
jgi:circadian clock protein KaiB